MKITKTIYAALTVFFLVAPLLVILPLAFTSSAFLTYPMPGWSMRWFNELFSNAVWSRSIVNTLIIAALLIVASPLVAWGPFLAAWWQNLLTVFPRLAESVREIAAFFF